MRKTPTLFKRDPADMRHVLPEVTPGCECASDAAGPHRATITVEWTPSASTGNTEAIQRLLESKCRTLLDTLQDWDLTEPRVTLDLDPTVCDHQEADTPTPTRPDPGVSEKCGAVERSHERTEL